MPVRVLFCGSATVGEDGARDRQEKMRVYKASARDRLGDGREHKHQAVLRLKRSPGCTWFRQGSLNHSILQRDPWNTSGINLLIVRCRILQWAAQELIVMQAPTTRTGLGEGGTPTCSPNTIPTVLHLTFQYQVVYFSFLWSCKMLVEPSVICEHLLLQPVTCWIPGTPTHVPTVTSLTVMQCQPPYRGSHKCSHEPLW